ncbi:hypothetical protein CPB84DRAFT_1850791 [Gymnopilus junonius]|uniref:VPS9 domain-containing protein n=1 Tax=Gymnopilus junonius TaxID=109634 RepID=A0A9P5NGT9_GYMJU|nr:hypothetical protein CPB84DRAFT_1850791 [Gymnopilus junonius]
MPATPKRDGDFPATSIGRSSGSRLHLHAASSSTHEAHAHPLLSPGRSSSPTPSEQPHSGMSPPTTNVNSNGGLGPQKYIPYTPRQRVTPTTTTTTVHPSTASPQHGSHQGGGDATSKLQLMHLKAAAQAIGLDSGTLGWTMLERLVMNVHGEGEQEEEGWTVVWNTITSGKATLLLPLETAFTHEKITADFFKDHIVLCDSPSRKDSSIVTFSGLRAGSSAPSNTTTISAASRIPNPFASLFGGNSASNSKSSSPAPAALSLSVPSSPPTSLRNLDTSASAIDTHPSTSGVIEISAFTIDRRIVRKEIAKEVNKALKNELKALLAASIAQPSAGTTNAVPVPIPGWVVERVLDLTKEWFPFVKKPSTIGSPLRKSHSGSGNSSSSGKEGGDEKGWTVNLMEENPEDVAQKLQDFYFMLEQDMRAGGTPFISRRKEREKEKERKDREKEDKHTEKEKEGSGGEEEAQDREKRVLERLEGESRIRDVMEAVERVVTSLFYDRLFMQATTDDASHDEALSNRIAALNMLDLSLRHLGIQVGSSSLSPTNGDSDEEEAEVDVVVKACGEILTQLDTCRSPSDKAAVLVAAHKVVVDGLSRLPPIRLISENDENNRNELERKGGYDEEEELKTAKPTSSTFAAAAAAAQSSPKKADSEGTSTSELGVGADTSGTTTPAPEGTSDIASAAAAGASDSLPSKPKAPPPPLPIDSSQPSIPSSQAQSSHQHPQLSPVPSKSKSNRKQDPTPVSGDVLLPLIIFSVVKSNPPHLVSNLLFTQRFRNQSVGGEESYCLINLMAVAEFLENVDMAGLGLGEVDKVVSTADLTPIPLTRSPVTAETPLEPVDGLPGSLRGRVGQQVDAIADSANKVISGVVDSSFGILRSFMPDPTKSPALPSSGNGRLTPNGAAAAGMSTGFGLLRRESGFSIASLAASLPVSIPGRARSITGGGEEAGQQLVTVSRPSSVKSFKAKSLRVKVGGSDEEEDDDESMDDEDSEHDRASEDGEVSNASADEGEEDGSAAEDGEGYITGGGDTRSIRSFESMLSASRQGSRGENKSRMSKARKSLSDRLASVSALAGRKTSPPPSSRRSSLLLQPRPTAGSPPASPRVASPSPILNHPMSLRLPPPKQRFMECTPDDLRLSEVGELLREYRRLVEGVRAAGGFDE